MFGDSDVEVTGFDSCSQSERLPSNSNKCNQTNSLITVNTEVQTHELKTLEIQTVQDEESSLASKKINFDIDKLASFLKKVLPKVEEELDDCIFINDAFGLNRKENVIDNGSDLDGGLNSSAKQINVDLEFIEVKNDKTISDLAWNSNGALLAAGFSEDVHNGWCNHEALINVYFTNKKQCKKPAFQNIQTYSCIKCIEFHPYISTILAGGFYSGEVNIWDLASCDEISFKSENENPEFHSDAVKCLRWKKTRNGTKLLSAGKDGKIIIWKITIGNLTFKPEERFVILPQNSVKIPFSQSNCLEINSIDFWNHNESDFIVAAGNQIFHCSLKLAKSVSSMTDYKDPFLMKYQPHEGPATCVSCLSHSNTFASSGIDGKIHVFKSEVSTPLYIINSDDPIINIIWSNSTNLFSWESFSTIKCYRFNSKFSNVVSTAVKEIDENITAMSSNIMRPGKLAVSEKMKIILLNDFE